MDFFRLQVRADLLFDPELDQAEFARPGARVVLELQRQLRPAEKLLVDGEPLPVVAFPIGSQKLVRLAVGPESSGESSSPVIDVLLPRQAFDAVAEDHGAPRLTKLAVQAGAAAADPVMRHLGASLDYAIDHLSPPGTATIDRIGQALTLHVAQRYGDFLSPAHPQRGGLAPWQLRLARKAIEHSLDGAVPLDVIARECGLSTSHFCRAFTRSTGLPPHRWLIHRRLDRAKDLMLCDETPLAQIALACGFSDQSHFTRTFASAMGMTPGRWRKARCEASPRELCGATASAPEECS